MCGICNRGFPSILNNCGRSFVLLTGQLQKRHANASRGIDTTVDSCWEPTKAVISRWVLNCLNKLSKNGK